MRKRVGDEEYWLGDVALMGPQRCCAKKQGAQETGREGPAHARGYLIIHI